MKPMSILKAWLLLCAAAMCSACGLAAGGSQLVGGTAPGTALTAPGALPSPADLRGTTFTPGVRSLLGSEYELGLPSSHVTPVAAALAFSAEDIPVVLADHAYAFYALDLSGYAGVSLLGLEWTGGAPLGGAYVGFANWNSDRWDWVKVPLTAETDVGPYGDYVRGSDGQMLLVVFSKFMNPATLVKIYFGVPGLEPPTNVEATDSAFIDKVVVSWDAPLSGLAPEGYAIYRSDSQAGSYLEIGTSATLNFEDLTAVQDTVYWYKVKSTKTGEADSAFSAEDSGIASAFGSGWTVRVASLVAPMQDPIYLSLAEVDGNPALIYNRNAAGYGIYYERAFDSSGTDWGAATQNLDSSGSGKEPSLAYIGGRPGFSLTDGGGGTDIFHRHGNDSAGSSWGSADLVEDLTGAHPLSDSDLLEVAGRPAVVFKHADFVGFSGTELCYMRANDALGDAWPANRTVVDAGEIAINPQLALLADGRPAVLYGESDNVGSSAVRVKYARATDTTGSSWQPPELVLTLANANILPQLQLIVANGRPAAVIHDSAVGTDELYYVRANDAVGSDWPLGATAIAYDVDFLDGAAVVNGHPAVAYVDTNGTVLRYREAIDLDGGTWYPAELVENNSKGLGIATLRAMGSDPQHPCIAYRVNRVDPDAGEIRFARKD
jgi:hypothetical protein